MNVAARRQQGIEVARQHGAAQLYGERLPLADRRCLIAAGEDGLLLLAPVEPDETPGEVIVDGGSGARRHDEGEEAEVAGGGAEEKPLADTAPRPAFRRGGLVLLREPALAAQELREERAEGLDGLRRIIGTLDLFPDAGMKERMAGVSRTYSSSSSGL